MAEDLCISNGGKEEKYRMLLPQIKCLIEGEDDLIANLANVAAALKETFHYFRTRQRTACYMTRKSIYIRYNQYFSPLPGLSANATPLLYSGTSHRTLKRGKHQILTFHQIKSHPEKVKSLFQCKGRSMGCAGCGQ